MFHLYLNTANRNACIPIADWNRLRDLIILADEFDTGSDTVDVLTVRKLDGELVGLYWFQRGNLTICIGDCNSEFIRDLRNAGISVCSV